MPSLPPIKQSFNDDIGFYLEEKTANLRDARVMMFEVQGFNETAPPKIPGGHRLVLPYLPEDLKRVQRAKTSVRLTQKIAWVDKYGDALPLWHLSGTTGWRKRYYPELGKNLDGYLAWKQVEEFFSNYQKNTVGAAEQGQDPPLMHFFHFYEEEFWVIEPLEINRFRNVRKPLIIGYELKFVGIHPLDYTPSTPYIPEFFSVFEPPDNVFLIDLQKQLILTLSTLAQVHLILGVFGADAAALKAVGEIELGISAVLDNINALQFNSGVMDLSIDTFITLGQSLLSFSSSITGNTAIAQTAAVIQLVSILNTTAVELFKVPSFPSLFSGSFSSGLLNGVSNTLDTATSIFQPLSL